MVAKAKTLADFRETHDPDVIIPRKIKEALAQMVKEGAEHWEYELEFMKRAGIGQTQLAQFRSQFEQHFVEARGASRNPKRVWFGATAAAKKARGE